MYTNITMQILILLIDVRQKVLHADTEEQLSELRMSQILSD